MLRLIAAPWKLIYYEAYLERGDALGRERYLKSGSGRKFLKVQVRHYLDKNHSPREHCFYALVEEFWFVLLGFSR